MIPMTIAKITRMKTDGDCLFIFDFLVLVRRSGGFIQGMGSFKLNMEEKDEDGNIESPPTGTGAASALSPDAQILG